MRQRSDAQADAIAHGDRPVARRSNHLNPVGPGRLELGVGEHLGRAEDVERLAALDGQDQDLAGAWHGPSVAEIVGGAKVRYPTIYATSCGDGPWLSGSERLRLSPPRSPQPQPSPRPDRTAATSACPRRTGCGAATGPSTRGRQGRPPAATATL